MSSYIGPITDTILSELRKPGIRDTIVTNVVDPLLADITAKYYPYFMSLVIILLIIIVLLVVILIISITNKGHS